MTHGRRGRFWVKRDWWCPLVVSVWEWVGVRTDWRRGRYELWVRRGTFIRSSTARAFVDHLGKQ